MKNKALMQMQRPVPIPPAWDLEAVAAARADAERAAAAGEVVMPPLDPTWHRIMSQKARCRVCRGCRLVSSRRRLVVLMLCPV